MHVSLEYYQPSGKFRPSILFYATVAETGGALLAGLYELLLFYIPFIYLNFLIVLAFGAVLGVMSTWVLDRSHCRNRVVSFLLAFAIGATGLLASYTWNYRRFVSAVIEQHPEWSPLEVALVGVPAFIEGRVEAGWQMKSSTMNGAFVWAIWGIEAAAVLGLAIFMVRDLTRTPYCEACRQWTKKQAARLSGLDRTAA